MITIVPKANEQSTIGFVCAFFDDDNQAVSPTQITWSLTDLKGQVINSRDQVAAVPDQQVTIVLSGLDLQIRAEEAGLIKVGRRLVIEAIYTSSLGSGLPLKEVAAFEVVNLVIIGG